MSDAGNRQDRPGGASAPPSCFTCQDRESAEWCLLTGDDLGYLDRARVHNTYQPGQVVFYQGNPCLGIYCIESGELALRKTDENGHSVIVRLAHAGQSLGYRAFFADDRYMASCEALTECTVCFIDREAVRRLIDRNPALGLRFLQTVSVDLREAEDSKLAAASLPIRRRFSHLLLTLKERHGSVDEDGNLHLKLPLSRRDLGALLGARPETIARTIRSLEDDGVATFDGREVIIKDLDVLLDEIETA